MVSNKELKEMLEAQGNDWSGKLEDLKNQMLQKSNHIEKMLGEIKIEVNNLIKLIEKESADQKRVNSLIKKSGNVCGGVQKENLTSCAWHKLLSGIRRCRV